MLPELSGTGGHCHGYRVKLLRRDQQASVAECRPWSEDWACTRPCPAYGKEEVLFDAKEVLLTGFNSRLSSERGDEGLTQALALGTKVHSFVWFCF